MIRFVLQWLLIGSISILVADILFYAFLPETLCYKLPGYRIPVRPIANQFGKSNYPQHYFKSHPTRGFDIQENSKGKHYIKQLDEYYEYDVWGNSLGCYDREHQQLSKYIYLAGDSGTWGYTAYEEKFGTLFEAQLGTAVLKCGVTHSGQKHQLSKAKEIIEKVGPPSDIVVLWTPNDIANDYSFPHSTVIDGWLLDNIMLDRTDQLVPLTEIYLRKRIASAEKAHSEREQSIFTFGDLKSGLNQYSASANIVRRVFAKIKNLFGTEAPLKKEKTDFNHIYTLDVESIVNGKVSYKESPYAAENKAALRAFDEFSRSINANFLVVLPYSISSRLSEVRDFLEHSGIDYLDLSENPDFLGIQTRWKLDPHLNPTGNKIVAKALYEHFNSKRIKEAP